MHRLTLNILARNCSLSDQSLTVSVEEIDLASTNTCIALKGYDFKLLQQSSDGAIGYMQTDINGRCSKLVAYRLVIRQTQR